jgi:hypothetical protein
MVNLPIGSSKNNIPQRVGRDKEKVKIRPDKARGPVLIA